MSSAHGVLALLESERMYFLYVVEFALTLFVVTSAYFHLTIDREMDAKIAALDPENVWGD